MITKRYIENTQRLIMIIFKHMVMYITHTISTVKKHTYNLGALPLLHSQKKWYYYSFICSYLKAVWSWIMEYYPVFLQLFLSYSCNQRSPTTYNHCLYTVQTALNFVASSFCCKITLIWLGSSLSVQAKSTLNFDYNGGITSRVTLYYHYYVIIFVH